MKSKIFAENPLPSKAFREHCLALSGLPSSVAQQVASFAWEYLRAHTEAEEAAVIGRMRAEMGLHSEQIQAALGIGSFFLRALDPDDDEQSVLEDVTALAELQGDQPQKLRPFLAALVAKFADVRGACLARATRFSALKVLRSTTRLVDLRAVFHDKYSVGDDVTSYRPAARSLIPIAILRLSFGEEDETVFQMDLRTLRLLQAELEALEKEMAAVVAAYPELAVERET